MKITVMTSDERFVSLDVDADELVENVKALLEVETQIPLHQQQLLHHGRELPNSHKLNAAGIVDNDLLMLVAAAPPPTSTSGSGGGNEMALNADGSAVNPSAFMSRLKRDPQTMKFLFERNPDIAGAVHSNNVSALQGFLRQIHQQKLDLQRRQQEEIALMNADPFDLDAQKRIEESIRQRNIDENWEAAVEHNPEAFASVIMLYVDMEVNGFPLKAFIDSGAQMTIISRTCAERCGLLRLLDKRYVGVARGVGQTEIVGRIHVAPLKIGDHFYPCSFTVLDQPNPEFIFGLDMLRKHQCSIDLKDNVLRVGGGEIAVPFLQEKDIPRHFHQDEVKPSASTSVLPAPAAAAPQASSDLEAKASRLMALGFDRPSALEALRLCNGNEEQAASYLFGG
ncbi:protein DDI1 homolog 2-like isoform X1 [Selaginella moellendorffii]|uniref:protein DDI1 homolog 2-like isoform X1 n=1 Tax=Selaginella moellendorffii TaxID=88036 RepID=UPI000D1CE8A0|nr:protein DDI1 homolog 2-like isoform X1 [Selaginella moellendorffii]|eukprot:XP_024520291.1 protein DDI1 homolog 2-like isoform X1 [Selaginella moellendorffii]